MEMQDLVLPQVHEQETDADQHRGALEQRSPVGFELSRPRAQRDTDAREQMYHDIASDICDKVSNIAIDGTPVVSTESYRVTVNSFLADGGDNYPVLIEGTNRLGGDVDLDALVAYFNANSPVAPGPQNRVTPAP